MELSIKGLVTISMALVLVGCGGGGSGNAPGVFTLSGSVSGLAGSGLKLQNNGTTLTVTTNGGFTFPGALGASGSYAVSVSAQPASPTQTCTVANGSGVVANANVANVVVTCITNSYTVSGAASGVEGTGLVLQINSANDVVVPADGPFAFAALPSGTAYSVTVKTQPSSPRQICTVSNSSGTVAAAAVNNVSVSCRSLVGKFLYVPNTGSHNVSAYAINPSTGALSAVAGAPFPSGNSPLFLTPDPNEMFIYSSNSGQAVAPTTPTAPSISGYAINSSTGALVEIAGSPFFVNTGTPPGSPQTALVFEPSARFTYVSAVNSGAPSIYGLSVSTTTGSLAPVPNSPFAVTSGPTVIAQGIFDVAGAHYYVPFGIAGGGIKVFDLSSNTGALSPNSVPSASTGGDIPFVPNRHPSGRYLYVPNLAAGSIAVFSIDPNTGVPSAIPGSPFATGGTYPAYTAVHPSGRFVFAANGNSLTSSGTPATVAAFTVDATTGSLSAVAGSPFPTQGTNATGDASQCFLDTQGKFLYVNNSSSDSIAVFSVDQTTGVLTAVPGSPFATGTRPSGAVPDPSGKYLYVVNRGAVSVSSYSVDQSTGVLTLINTLATGTSPNFFRIVGLQ